MCAGVGTDQIRYCICSPARRKGSSGSTIGLDVSPGPNGRMCYWPANSLATTSCLEPWTKAQSWASESVATAFPLAVPENWGMAQTPFPLLTFPDHPPSSLPLHTRAYKSERKVFWYLGTEGIGGALLWHVVASSGAGFGGWEGFLARPSKTRMVKLRSCNINY